MLRVERLRFPMGVFTAVVFFVIVIIVIFLCLQYLDKKGRW